MPPEEESARRELLRFVRRGAREGVLRGTFGNVSVRLGDRLLITPTASDYLRLRAVDLALVRLDGTVEAGRPSSETQLHLAIYRRLPYASAVWHDHAAFAVAAALVADEVPIFTGEGHGLIGPSLPVAAYRPAGSEMLAEEAAALLQARQASACLLRNHGLCAVGRNLMEAYSCAIAADEAAQHFLLTRGMEPKALDQEEAERIRRSFADYRMH